MPQEKEAYGDNLELLNKKKPLRRAGKQKKQIGGKP